MNLVFQRLLMVFGCFSTLSTAMALDRPLPRSTPEQQQVSSAAVLEFLKAADEQVDSIHSVMIVRNGHVIAEAWWPPAAPELPHVLWSLSKSFTSTAVGLAVDEGKLSLDDKVTSFFANKVPEKPSPNLAEMTIRDLLTMSAGHADEVDLRGESDWVAAFLNHDVPYRPGTHFKYNTPATFMLSAIVQEVTGQTVREYLQPRLFEPLGIEQPTWNENPQGISLGGYGLYLKTEDIAKFGQLYLQEGRWQDNQLIPADWVRRASAKQIDNGDNPDSDWNQGYGFQFWRCRHDAYRGDGKNGQFCFVMPEQRMVVVMTAETNNLQRQLNLVWEYLLPGVQSDPIMNGESDQQALQRWLSANHRTGQIKALTPEVQTAEWAVQWWKPRHQEKLDAAAKRDRVDLLMIGDSITHAWESTGKKVWDHYYADRYPFNLGFSGDRTEQVLWRFAHGELDSIEPKLAVIMIGTNNTGHRQDEPEHTAAGIEAIIHALHQRLPSTKVLLLAVFPRGESPDDPLRRLNDEINAEIAGLAEDERVTFLDVGGRFLDERGMLSESVMPDLLHPNEDGYRIWAEAMEPQISALLEEADYVRVP